MGYPSLNIVSGTGHDAISMSGVADPRIVFGPCKDGISHNELERANVKGLEVGVSVLQNVLLLSAGAVEHD